MGFVDFGVGIGVGKKAGLAFEEDLTFEGKGDCLGRAKFWRSPMLPSTCDPVWYAPDASMPPPANGDAAPPRWQYAFMSPRG